MYIIHYPYKVTFYDNINNMHRNVNSFMLFLISTELKQNTTNIK